MDNHSHLLIETPEGNLVAGMRRLNQVYTQSFDRRHGRVRHVLQGRYKSILVDNQSCLLAFCWYVALNPVRARWVGGVRDWRWSSYRATAGSIKAPAWLSVEWLLVQFIRQRDKARVAYRRVVPRPRHSRTGPPRRVCSKPWPGNSASTPRRYSPVPHHQPAFQAALYLLRRVANLPSREM